MPDKDPATAAAEAAAKELVKVAYGDLLQPAAQEVGAELGEFVRAIMVAGRGFGYLIRETYEPFVIRALGRIPAEHRVLPPPPLLGQVLEGISYETKGSPIYEMFDSLLTGAMNVETADSAHPSFAPIIRSLSRDEAAMLKLLKRSFIPVFNPITNIVHTGIYDNNEYDLTSIDIVHAGNAGMYIEHLYTLGLLAWQHTLQHNETVGSVEGSRSFLGLSVMGKAFIRACIPD